MKSTGFISTLPDATVSAASPPKSLSMEKFVGSKSALWPRSKSKNCVFVNIASESSILKLSSEFCRSCAVGIAFKFAMYSDTFGPLLPLYAIVCILPAFCSRGSEVGLEFKGVRGFEVVEDEEQESSEVGRVSLSLVP